MYEKQSQTLTKWHSNAMVLQKWFREINKSLRNSRNISSFILESLFVRSFLMLRMNGFNITKGRRVIKTYKCCWCLLRSSLLCLPSTIPDTLSLFTLLHFGVNKINYKKGKSSWHKINIKSRVCRLNEAETNHIRQLANG